MSFVVIIPARYASTRLPGKPLLDIAGKPMILHVLDRAREAGADDVWVATDHAGIAAAVEAAGGRPGARTEQHRGAMPQPGRSGHAAKNSDLARQGEHPGCAREEPGGAREQLKAG